MYLILNIFGPDFRIQTSESGAGAELHPFFFETTSLWGLKKKENREMSS